MPSSSTVRSRWPTRLAPKGVAELGLCGVAPAIANAVWHATGLRMRELPITLDKLLVATVEQLA